MRRPRHSLRSGARVAESTAYGHLGGAACGPRRTVTASTKGAVMTSTDPRSDRIPLMLIHGAWLSARSWERFGPYFDRRGFDVSTPEWPRKEGDVEQLRENTDELKGLGL